MKRLFVGSGNSHKIQEIKDIFKNNGIEIEIVSPKDFDDNSDPVEDGFSFEENAIIKAKFYYDKYHISCIGEDSGITIEYFNNYPGIHSKRFLSNLNDRDKNEYVLDLMKNINNRKAVFHAVVCYIDEDGNTHTFEGLNEGSISLIQKGSEGFGYDPIFQIDEYQKTEAELGQEYKNKNSHRAKAFKKLIDYIKYEKS